MLQRSNKQAGALLESVDLVMDVADIPRSNPGDAINDAELLHPPNGGIDKDPSPVLPTKTSSRKRGGLSGTAKATESAFSSLLQPILALFPPSQTSGPLAPAFEPKPSTSQKDTAGKQSNGPSGKTKAISQADDDEPFVIYQPASWTAKRPKLSAARMAVTFDWKTDVFGPSPNAVHGQRTKYSKPRPRTPLVREVGPSIHHSVLLRGMLRDRAGSLASMSDVSSFASTREDEMEGYLITPIHDQTPADVAVASQSVTSFAFDESMVLPELPTSPTGAVLERLSLMAMVSPNTSSHPQKTLGQAFNDGEDVHPGSAPHTPLTPREIPDSDDDSDSD